MKGEIVCRVPRWEVMMIRLRCKVLWLFVEMVDKDKIELELRSDMLKLKL